MSYQPHQSEDITLKPVGRAANPIPPWERLAVNGVTAAQMMGCSRSTFFQRVKDGVYPKPAKDGLWNVDALKACRAQLAQ